MSMSDLKQSNDGETKVLTDEFILNSCLEDSMKSETESTSKVNESATENGQSININLGDLAGTIGQLGQLGGLGGLGGIFNMLKQLPMNMPPINECAPKCDGVTCEVPKVEVPKTEVPKIEAGIDFNQIGQLMSLAPLLLDFAKTFAPQMNSSVPQPSPVSRRSPKAGEPEGLDISALAPYLLEAAKGGAGVSVSQSSPVSRRSHVHCGAPNTPLVSSCPVPAQNSSDDTWKVVLPMLSCVLPSILDILKTPSSDKSSLNSKQLEELNYYLPQIISAINQNKSHETERIMEARAKDKEEMSKVTVAMMDALCDGATSAKYMDERSQAMCFIDKIYSFYRMSYRLASDLGADGDKYLALKMKLADDEISKQFINVTKQLNRTGNSPVAVTHGCY